MAAHAESRRLLASLSSVVSELGLTLDMTTSTASMDPVTNAYDVEVYVSGKGLSDQESVRRMQASAVMCAIMHAFPNLPHVRVHVPPLVPAVMQANVSLLPPARESVLPLLYANAKGVFDLVMQARRTLVEASVEQLIEAYPWRNVDHMRSLAIPLVHKKIHNPYPISQLIDMDDLLPRVDSFLPPHDAAQVGREVEAWMGRAAKSRMETYEAVYRMMYSSPGVSLPVLTTFHAIFDLGHCAEQASAVRLRLESVTH